MKSIDYNIFLTIFEYLHQQHTKNFDFYNREDRYSRLPRNI